MENEELPQYMRIAVSVAGRIADGQLAEGEKLSGRSKLSSEYQVSPKRSANPCSCCAICRS